MPPALPPSPPPDPDAGILAAPPPLPDITSFFSAQGAELALAASKFGQEEFVHKLVAHTRHPDPQVSLAALRQLQKYLLDTANLSGLVVKARTRKESTNAEGTRTVADAVTSTLLSRISSPPAPPLPAGTVFHAPRTPAQPAPAPDPAPDPPSNLVTD